MKKYDTLSTLDHKKHPMKRWSCFYNQETAYLDLQAHCISLGILQAVLGPQAAKVHGAYSSINHVAWQESSPNLHDDLHGYVKSKCILVSSLHQHYLPCQTFFSVAPVYLHRSLGASSLYRKD
uniref:Uncharacterized protein n=1 Tax=Opuntia streptacantha TaxID=393608 RepID=A0A7C9FDW8_OPUST